MTISEALRWATTRLENKGIDSARLDAEVLLKHILNSERVQLYIEFSSPLAEVDLETFKALIERREKREPVAYLIGYKEFMGLKFFVNESTLIPRPETEFLVEKGLKITSQIGKEKGYITIADVGCGSGAIAISLAKYLSSDCSIYALDISSSALEVAQRNGEFHRVSDKIEFLEGNLLDPLQDISLDLVVANLPYISREEMGDLPPEVRDYEPDLALDGDKEGLKLIRSLSRQAFELLSYGGAIALEVGYGQAEEVKDFLRGDGFSKLEVIEDYSEIERVISAYKLAE